LIFIFGAESQYSSETVTVSKISSKATFGECAISAIASFYPCFTSNE